MSLKWDDIESRERKMKQQEKELKDFLIRQQDEVRKRYVMGLCRKQQERASEREYSRQLVFGKVLLIHSGAS
jgi:type III secretory pathway component EscR